jgi:two-component system NtrC family sensor kinase
LFLSRDGPPARLPVDLNETVERTVALRRYELRMENIEVQLELDRHLPLTLADAGQLQQVLLNLMINAEQAIQQDRGRGHIWIRTRRIDSGRVAVMVADDGPGIPPGHAARIFDPFFTTKPPGMGTGLGLAIAYGIVHDHGGELVAECRQGGGAQFIVELPVAIQNPPVVLDRRVQSEAMVPEPDTGLPSRTILVVEDEPTVAHLIADVLGEEGHVVDIVLDSRHGLDRAQRQDYDLVLCDLRMPYLDGRGFYRELVRRGSPLQDRLIFVTGDTLAPRTVQFLQSGGLPYLAKPFFVEELKETVHRALYSGQ